MMLGASEMQVLVRKGRRVSLHRTWGRSGGFLYLKDIQYMVATIKAKARAGARARQGR